MIPRECDPDKSYFRFFKFSEMKIQDRLTWQTCFQLAIIHLFESLRLATY